MPKRAHAQKVGSLGERIAAVAFQRLAVWVVRKQDEDFGIDLEIEHADPNPTARFLKCQIKSFRGRGMPIAPRLKKEFVRYVYECRIPVILVLVDVNTESIWCCWIQGWIETRRLQSEIYNVNGKSLAIPADMFRMLNAEQSRVLAQIASGVHPIARSMHVRDLLRFGLETRDHEVIESATRLLFRFGKEAPFFPLAPVLDEVLALGERIWATIEGNAISKLLYAVARHHGDQVSKEQVRKLVIRDDTYSRTGINALSIMYDEFPHHMRELQLSNSFRNHPDKRAAYFCDLREKFQGVSIIQLMQGEYDCEMGSLILHPAVKESGFNKWVNRGDCAILDFVFENLPEA